MDRSAEQFQARRGPSGPLLRVRACPRPVPPAHRSSRGNAPAPDPPTFPRKRPPPSPLPAAWDHSVLRSCRLSAALPVRLFFCSCRDSVWAPRGCHRGISADAMRLSPLRAREAGRRLRRYEHVGPAPQVRIDGDLWSRVEREATRRGASVSALVREAIDERFPGDLEARRAALEAMLGAVAMGGPGPRGAEGRARGHPGWPPRLILLGHVRHDAPRVRARGRPPGPACARSAACSPRSRRSSLPRGPPRSAPCALGSACTPCPSATWSPPRRAERRRARHPSRSADSPRRRDRRGQVHPPRAVVCQSDGTTPLPAAWDHPVPGACGLTVMRIGWVVDVERHPCCGAMQGKPILPPARSGGGIRTWVHASDDPGSSSPSCARVGRCAGSMLRRLRRV